MLSSKTLLVAASLLATVTTAHGQVTSTKKSAKPADIVSGQTANVQLRAYAHDTFKEEDHKQHDKVVGITQVRANYTVKTFNDLISTTGVFAASTTNTNRGQVIQRQPRIITSAAVLDTAFFGFDPYVEIYTPMKGKPGGTRTDIVLAPTLKHPPVATAIGDLAASFRVEGKAVFYSRPQDADVRTNTGRKSPEGLGLVAHEDGSEEEVPQQKMGQPYEVWYVPEVRLDMDRVAKGLQVYTYVEYINFYNPYIEATPRDMTNKEYETVKTTMTYLGLEYALSDKLTFVNETYFGNKDLWGRRGSNDGDNIRTGNISMLQYTLF